MLALAIVGLIVFVGLIFGPRMWINAAMARHSVERTDFPGTGHELARHLLDQAGLQDIKVERVTEGDHYSPIDKAVRLSEKNYDGKSVTAVAVAAHEVGHALQDRDGYRPLRWRQKMIGTSIHIERIGSILLMATPLVFALVRSPVVLVAEILIALSILASTIVIHLVTLPTEFDASFKKALPVLTHFLDASDMPAARQVLKAAAFTYVANALISLINVGRWFRILRF